MRVCIALLGALIASSALAVTPKDTKKSLVQVAEDESKNRPVTKVINLLKDMVEQLEKEGEEDEEIYETMGCWCTTNDKAKTKSITEGETLIDTLTASIEQLTATSSELNTEIANLQTEVAKNNEALDKATALREKQLAEFTAEEKETTLTIMSLKNAVIALAKHHEGAALLQGASLSTDHSKVAESLQHIVHKHADMLTETLTIPQLKSIVAFVGKPVSLLQGDPRSSRGETADDILNSFKRLMKQRHIKDDPSELAYNPYNVNGLKPGMSFNPITGMLQGAEPASGAIYGVLKQMKENFETNLKQSQQEEAKSDAEFTELKATKEDEIATGKDQIDTKTTTLAQTDEKNAEDKQSLEDAQNTLAADQKFLADLKERCASMDKEFEERTKTRQLEIAAVSKALAFLNSDEAHALFTRTFNPSLFQMRMRTRSSLAARVLDAAAKKYKSEGLARIAAHARMNPVFKKVNSEVTKMIDALTKEKNDEIKMRDFCIDEFNTNEREQEQRHRDKDDLTAKIADLKETIKTLEQEIELLKAQIADLQVEMKKAEENRKKENEEFQQVVADQKATQKLLAMALKILQNFYDKAFFLQKGKGGMQLKGKEGQAPPPGFKSYENNAASGGVMGMMEHIITDAKAMEAEAVQAEGKAQQDYEDYVQETNNSIETKTRSITNKSEGKAKAEVDLTQALTDMDDTLTSIETLENEEHDLHKKCDFTLKNFESTQAARDGEIESLRQSIRIFQGASFQEFLQDNGY